MVKDSLNTRALRRHIRSSFVYELKKNRTNQTNVVMADRNEKMLLELLKIPGNSECADCGSKGESK